MITSRNTRRYRDILAYAFIISVLIHIFGGSFVVRAARIVAKTTMGDTADDLHERTSVIRLERRPIPAPVVRAPRPVVRHVEHEIAPAIPKLPRPEALGLSGASTRVAYSLPHSIHELARTKKGAPSQATVTAAGSGTPEVAK